MMALSSSGHGEFSSEPTSSEMRSYPTPHKLRREVRSNSEYSLDIMDGSIPVVHSDESVDHGHHYDVHDSSSDEERAAEHLRAIHERYEREIAAAHREEDEYYEHYQRLQEDMRHLAEEAERAKDEA